MYFNNFYVKSDRNLFYKKDKKGLRQMRTFLDSTRKGKNLLIIETGGEII